MSTFRVTAEQLTIHPHDNADALELAQVGLYRAVVAKGMYRTGDWAVYIPEGSVVPAPLVEELGLTGRLAGPESNRVKAVRLRGELSQGIVCRPAVITADLATAGDYDFAAELGIVKYVPPVPVHMSGEVRAAAELIRWVDIEDIKRYPAIFTPGEPVVATEKVHGTACLLTWTPDEVLVSSKGFGSKDLSLVEASTNLYWRAVRAHGIPEAAAKIADMPGVAKVGVFGEVYGRGVQDLAYGGDANKGNPGYAMFDIAVAGMGGAKRWLDSDEVRELAQTLDIPIVPRLYEGPYDADAMLELATGKEGISGKQAHLREGIVLRPAVERYSDVLGGRAIAKVVSPAYLTRKGGTEFE